MTQYTQSMYLLLYCSLHVEFNSSLVALVAPCKTWSWWVLLFYMRTCNNWPHFCLYLHCLLDFSSKIPQQFTHIILSVKTHCDHLLRVCMVTVYIWMGWGDPKGVGLGVTWSLILDLVSIPTNEDTTLIEQPWWWKYRCGLHFTLTVYTIEQLL